MRNEKSPLQLYKEMISQKEPKFYNLNEVRDVLGKVGSFESFPIVIDENEIKTSETMHDIESLKDTLIIFIDAWQRVFQKKPLTKNITQVSEGRLSETELKIIYIDVFSIEKKYPEFNISRLMEVLEYPDFSEILVLSDQINSKWFLLMDELNSVCSLEDIYNNGDPTIDKKWEEKLKSKNSISIKNEDERAEAIVIFSFIEAFLQLLSFSNVSRSDYFDVLDVMGRNDFIEVERMRIQLPRLQSILGLTKLNLS
jgi:hypothetical protein